MNKSIHENNELQRLHTYGIPSKSCNNYLERDLASSPSILNELFPDFDAQTDKFESLIRSNTDVNCTNPSVVLSSSKINWESEANVHSIPSFQPDFDEVLSSDSFTLLFEQNQNPSTNNHALSSTSFANISLDNHESMLTNQPTYQLNQINATRYSQSTSSSVQFPDVLQKTEPITVTLDQFQSLLAAIPTTGNISSNKISALLENSTLIGNNIPLRIIHNNNGSDRANNSNDVNGENLLTKNNNHESIIVSGNDNRPRRKSSHNAIEKRYRSSINEKINELKDIVAATDEKIQKSGILRRTIQFIAQLQSTNRRLEEENTTLKSILKQLNLTSADIPNNNHVQSSTGSSSIKSSSSAASTISTDSNDDDDDDLDRHTRKRKRRTNSKRGMADGSRLLLCCFMFCVFLTNPFNYLLDRLHTSNIIEPNEIQTILSSRTLQDVQDQDNFNALSFLSVSWKQLIGWMLNVAICLVCLVKIFVHGEPIVHESDMNEYYTFKKKADTLMSQHQYSEAHTYYRKCCEKLFISVDSTYLYYFSSIMWQIIRWCLNVIFVGRWLTYWSGWTQSIDTRNYNRELNYCYLQLWKIEYHYSKSSLNLLNLFLLTMNTSINSGKKLDHNKHNEIWLLSAFTFKKLNGLFSLLIPYILRFLIPVDIKDIWMCDIDRLNQFIFEENINLFKRNSFLESIRVQFLENILHDNILDQLVFQDEPSLPQQQYQWMIEAEDKLDDFAWWQHCLRVMRCISNDKQNINDMTSTNVLHQTKSSYKTIYQRAKVLQLVDEQYIVVMETIHIVLIVLTNDDNQTNSTRLLLLERLGQASQLLTFMIGSAFSVNNDENNIDTAIKALLLDGILSLRLRLLTCSMVYNDQQIPFLNDFQRELDYYRHLTQLIKLPKFKLYLFESIFRTSVGLNPLQTQTLFECAIKQSKSIVRTKQEPSLNLDVISAILLFCHFSPTTVYRYRNILQQATTISSNTNKNNDLNRLQKQCLTLMRQPYFTM